jgi:hypothetical protein
MPSNPCRRRGSGSLGQLKARLWLVVELCTDTIEDPSSSLDGRFRASHCLVQAAGAYTKLVEAADLEKRICALEAMARRPR